MATTKLGEKPIVEEIGDGDHFIMEINGNIRRFPAAAISPSVPVIDLVSHGVILSAASASEMIPESVGEQIKAAAMAGGAIIKIVFLADGIPLPVQGYFSGAAIEMANTYQLSGRFYLNGGISVFLSLKNSMTYLSLEMVPDPDPLPEPNVDGDFLRARDGAWVSEAVPAAEEASF
ncbi:hypothetical protein [Intestinimonas massiliensis (ex Afouda et al. 2020)]|uniref:hypothetical protein n=1 Tax=Intestinimonas massiliensis (ex Afouda et al. 2020) TaxID=1673721 RepID=UPI00102FE83D|nr:hypothetical protein [Intestinimonas massiliensis (ex Afouda et al. 2020)]